MTMKCVCQFSAPYWPQGSLTLSCNKNCGTDALSRRGQAPDDSESSDDVDEYFESRLYNTQAQPVSGPINHIARIWLLEGEYEGQDLILSRYLETLQRPDGLTDAQFRQLQEKSRSFFMHDGLLFKCNWKSDLPLKRVLGRRHQCTEAIRILHDENGHCGLRSTYEDISRRHQWKGMYNDVFRHVKTCRECQRGTRIW